MTTANRNKNNNAANRLKGDALQRYHGLGLSTVAGGVMYDLLVEDLEVMNDEHDMRTLYPVNTCSRKKMIYFRMAWICLAVSFDMLPK